jgi:hypothetical protein
MGAIFLEFLRCRLNGTGYPDAHPRSARMITNMGQGSGFKVAFQKEFGTTVEDAQAQFVKFIAETQNDPTERLKGTVYEGH